MKTITNRIRATFRNLARDRRGDGFLDLAFKILIIVVLGAAILLILNALFRSVLRADRQDQRRADQRQRPAVSGKKANPVGGPGIRLSLPLWEKGTL